MSSLDYHDPRAHALRERHLSRFGGEEIPVSVESIAEDLLGLAVDAVHDLECSGMLLSSERRILVNAAEPEERRRFTIAHELGHWICQCLEGTVKPVYCRADEIGVDPEAKKLEREANIFAANLLMPASSVWGARGATDRAVSDEAFAWRRYNLGLVEERPSGVGTEARWLRST